MIEVEEITFSRGGIGGKEALFATTILDRQGLVTREYNLGIEIESHRIFGDYIGADGWVDLDDDEARELADKFGMTEQMIEAAEEAKRRDIQEREIANAAYVLQDNHGAPQCGVETLYFETYEDLTGYLDAHLEVNDRITEGYAIVTDGDRYRAAIQESKTNHLKQPQMPVHVFSPEKTAPKQVSPKDDIAQAKSAIAQSNTQTQARKQVR